MDEEQTEEMVKKSRFLDSQRTVAELLAERERIMDALIGLVNASHPYRSSAVRLAHQQDMTKAWEVAYQLCEQWQKIKAPAGNADAS